MEWHISSFSFNCFLPTPAFLHCHSLKKSSKEKLNAKNWNESADILRSVCSQWLKEAAAQIKLYLRKNTNGLKSNSEKCSKSIRRRNNFAFGAFVWNTSGVFLTALVYTFICAVEKKKSNRKRYVALYSVFLQSESGNCPFWYLRQIRFFVIQTENISNPHTHAPSALFTLGSVLKQWLSITTLGVCKN